MLGGEEMIKIAIGGQMNKSEIKECAERLGNSKIEADIMTDLEAAIKVKNGQYDYYLGACQSGAGGALAMAIGILGSSKCCTIAMAGRAPKIETVKNALARGVKAFGFTNDHVQDSVKILTDLLLDVEDK